MRVAVVYHFFAHYRGPVITELRSSDQFDFVFLSGKEVSSSYSRLKLYDFNEAGDYIELQNSWFFNHFLWQRGLLTALSKNRFDAVIFLGDWKFISTWIALAFLKFNGIPTLFWSHGLRSTTSSLNDKLKFFYLKLFTHGGFVYDNWAKEVMQKKGFSKPLQVIYNSLDYYHQQNVLKSIENEPFVAVDRPYVVFSGRIESRKRLDQIIKAIALLKGRHVEIDAIIIGEGSSKSELIELSRQLEVKDNIRLIGSCYDEQILCKYFYNSIACIIPSAVGLTAIHALTYGTPVIADDDFSLHGPEIESVKEGVSGFFYKKFNDSSLASVIEHVLTLSPSMKIQIRENCQKIINENFTPAKQLHVIELHLNSIFNGKQD